MRHDPPDPLSRRLARTLDLRDVTPRQAQRLAAARRRAVALGGRGGWLQRGPGLLAAYAGPALRTALSVVLVSGLMFAGLYSPDEPTPQPLRYVDGALLVDDLPIDAYLDDGFRAWVADTSSNS